jgi:predicted RNase H-like HicB family nuclease
MENFTGILIKSKDGRGYTAIVAEYPGVIAEGETKEEAKRVLIENLHLVLEFKRKQSFNTFINSDIESFALA